jgi:hypothetical protein
MGRGIRYHPGPDGVYMREGTKVKSYTSTSSQPSECSSNHCRNDARFKSEDGRFFYCEPGAKSELKTNADELAAALLRLIDAERHHVQKFSP